MRVPVATNRVNLASVTDAKYQSANFNGTGGEAFGRGLQEIGSAGRAFADREQQRKDLFDEAGAKKIDVETRQAWNEVVQPYYSSKGFAAVGMRKDVEERLEQARKEAVSRASSPEMAYLVEQSLAARLANEREAITRHYDGEASREYENQSVARAESFIEEALTARTPDARAASIAGGSSEIEALGNLKGWSPEVVSGKKFDYESSIHLRVGEGLVDAESYDEAAIYLEENAGKLNAKDEASLRQSLRKPMQDREAETDWKQALGLADPVLVTVDSKASNPSPKSAIPKLFRNPVSPGAGVSSRFQAPRARGPHSGTDFTGPLGSPVRAMAPGVVEFVDSEGKGDAGIHVIVRHGNGLTTSYSHLGKTNLRSGDAVDADTVLGPIGMTGRTTGPHVHVVARRNKQRIDPESLIGKDHGSEAPSMSDAPRRWNVEDGYSKIDRLADRDGWSFEKTQRAKEAFDTQVRRDDSMIARREREADRQADEVILSKGEGFASSAIPRDIWNNMSVSARQQATNVEQSIRDRNERQADAVKEAADKETSARLVLGLKGLAINDPESFRQMPLGQYVGKLSTEQIGSLLLDQAKLNRKDPENANIDSEIRSHISMYAESDASLKRAMSKGDVKARVAALSKQYLLSATQGRTKPSDVDYRAAFDRATMEVWSVDQGKAVPLYAAEGRVKLSGREDAFISPARHKALRDRFMRSNGKEPTAAELKDLHERVYGK